MENLENVTNERDSAQLMVEKTNTIVDQLEVEKTELDRKLKSIHQEFGKCLNDKVQLLHKLSNLESEVKMCKSSEHLDKIVSLGRRNAGLEGLGFRDGGKPSNVAGLSQVQMDKNIHDHPRPPKGRRVTSPRFIPTCYQCGINGHIRPNCTAFRRNPR